MQLFYKGKGTESIYDVNVIKIIIISSVWISIFICIQGCKKLVEIPDPINSITTSKTFDKEATATSAIVAIYSNMSWLQNGLGYANGAITIYTGMSSDELIPYGAANNPFFVNTLNSSISDINNAFWSPAYFHIYLTNSAIEGLQASTTLPTNVKNQLMGEAKFLRALSHFYLVNLFGDIPLITISSFATNSVLERSSMTKVYQQIIEDLKEAKVLLMNDYTTFGGERIRATKWAAMALLARAYLYTGDWANAEAQSTEVISNSSLFGLTSLDSAFLKNNIESIWQLQLIDAGSYATKEGNLFIPTLFARNFPPNLVDQHSSYFTPAYYLTDQLINAFEAEDMRKLIWADSTGKINGINYYYPYKYKVKQGSSGNITEYNTLLRLGEQYLIRAEAIAKQNKLSAAVSDLNVIRARAGLAGLATSLTQEQVLAAVAEERRVELFAEYGNRWFDLKRTGQANLILDPIKGANWQTTDQVYPIPLTELQKNPNLTQNQGYQ